MNENKLKQLFEAARNQTAPMPPSHFESRVLREIQCEPAARTTSVFDQLNFLFPRIVFAAVAIIIASAVVELAWSGPDVADSAAQISEQWLFATN